jgi:hypothetical protein
MTETFTTAPVENVIATTLTDIPKESLTNFLLEFTFTADSTHAKGFIRTGKDITWIINGIYR